MARGVTKKKWGSKHLTKYSNVFNMLAAGARMGYNAWPKRTQTQTKKGTSSGNEVTVQRDSKVQYVRHRMPRWKKKRWSKFVRKVDWIGNHRQPKFTLLRHFEYASSSTAGNQYIACDNVHFGFYGNAVRMNNIIDAWLAEQGYNTTALRKGKKFFISSLTDDYTVKNAGTTDAEVDVYEMLVIKDQRYSVGTLGAQYPTMEQILDELASDNKTFAGSLSIVGVNPFNVSSWSRNFKVLRKIKHFLTPGAFFTHQIRTTKDKMFSCDSIIPQEDNLLAVGQQPGLSMKAGLTRVTLFVHRGEPQFSGGGISEIGPSQLIIEKVVSCHGAVIDPTQRDLVDN